MQLNLSHLKITKRMIIVFSSEELIFPSCLLYTSVEFFAVGSERIKARGSFRMLRGVRSGGNRFYEATARAPTSVIGILLIGRCIIHLGGFPPAPGVLEITKILSFYC